jgi:predicted phage terminase large subunit-like protein
MAQVEVDLLPALDQLLDKRRVQEEAESLALSFREFVPEAWKVLKPDTDYKHNWHIDAICEHLEAVTRREINHLQIWMPPVSMKTLLVSVMWPAWEWTHTPSRKYICASYSEPYAGTVSALSRTLIRSPWYQERWGRDFSLISETLLYYTNDRGGTRLACSPEGRVTGLHGNRIIVDDLLKPSEAEAVSGSAVRSTNNWFDSDLSNRHIPDEYARIIVMQRIHENDVAMHALEKRHYNVLALPERRWKGHPYAWHGDPRSNDGELLWPEFRSEEESKDMESHMLSWRVAGQLQQWPTTREGEILKRHHWRFYDPKLFRDEKLAERRPKFRLVVQSVDTPLKDKESNDLVAIQAWGAVKADRYLLDSKKGHMNYSQAKRAILEQARYVRQLYKGSAHYVLIENAGYGVELIDELKKEVTGVVKISRGADGDKILRAEAAAADLESGNCYLPGYREGSDEFSMPDEARCPADVVDFIDSCAIFPNGRNDDDVDAWSQCMNWLRSRTTAPARTWSSFKSARR